MLMYAAHIAYCVPLLKIADFLTAGVNVKVLLAGELVIRIDVALIGY